MRDKRGLIFVILLGLTIGFLCGCAGNNYCNYDLEYGSFCSSSKQKLLTDKLRHQGVQVNYFGDYIYIILPARMLFVKESDKIKPEANNTFNLIAAFLRCYQKVTVRVIGFADTRENGCNVVLAHQQARKVVNNLWEKRVDARLMYSSGRRASTTVEKAYLGNRIEIITKRLP